MGRFTFLATVFVLLTGAPLARADLLPTEEAQCQGKEAGDACGTGTCKAARCTRIDYANWDQDASAVPPSVEEDCLKCEGDSGATDGGSRTPTKEEATADDDNTKSDSRDTAESSSPKSDTEKEEADSGDDSSASSSCTVVLGRAASSAGPWLLALGFALFVGRRRRQT